LRVFQPTKKPSYKNVRIGDGVVVTPHGKPDNLDGENYYIRDGVAVVPKGEVRKCPAQWIRAALDAALANAKKTIVSAG
jgi:hypothetical protein